MDELMLVVFRWSHGNLHKVIGKVYPGSPCAGFTAVHITESDNTDEIGKSVYIPISNIVVISEKQKQPSEE